MMELNFCYEFFDAHNFSNISPVFKDIDTVDLNTVGDLNVRTVGLIYRSLIKKYPDIKFNLRNYHVEYYTKERNNYETYIEYLNSFYVKREVQYSRCLITIENPKNGKFIIISSCDNLMDWYPLLYHFGNRENCVDILAPCGVATNWPNCTPMEMIYPEFKYTPISNKTGDINVYNRIEEINKNKLYGNRVIPDKLFFRGQRYGMRLFLAQFEDVFKIETSRIHGTEFVNELNRYSIGIDINGPAELSCRTLDIMGLGIALIRPKLVIQFHNKLIPDFHYAHLKCDALNDPKTVRDAYLDEFEKLKKDEDFRKFISENGKNWYQENCTLDNLTKIIINNTILEKLI